MDNIKQGVDLAAEISKQLITLSTAILALTITFAKPFSRTATPRQRYLLIASWCTYLLVILFALWHLSALAGNLLNSAATSLAFESARTPAKLQIGAFGIATLLFVCFAISVSRSSLARPASVGPSEVKTAANEPETPNSVITAG